MKDIPDVKNTSNEELADYILALLNQKSFRDLEETVEILIEKIKG